jgi:hypothetical protein
MVELYGLRTDYAQHLIGGSFEREEVRDLVAVFDTEQMAMDYVKNIKSIIKKLLGLS